MVLSYNELVALVEKDVVNAPFENINAASIDLTLGDALLIQPDDIDLDRPPVDLCDKSDGIDLIPFKMGSEGYVIAPGEFLLATTAEWFDFSVVDDVSAEFKLKSSLARNGLSHMLAGWMDSGWSGNLTLEYHNVTRQPLRIRPGMKCGQAIFMRHAPVPNHASYAVKGQYNGQVGVQASKGVR